MNLLALPKRKGTSPKRRTLQDINFVELPAELAPFTKLALQWGSVLSKRFFVDCPYRTYFFSIWMRFLRVYLLKCVVFLFQAPNLKIRWLLCTSKMLLSTAMVSTLCLCYKSRHKNELFHISYPFHSEPHLNSATIIQMEFS